MIIDDIFIFFSPSDNSSAGSLSCLCVVNAAGTVNRIGSSSLSCLCVINATGTVNRIGSSSLSCLCAVSATGAIFKIGVSDLSCLCAVNAIGIVSKIGSSDLSCLCAVNALGTIAHIGSSNLSCLSVIDAVGNVVKTDSSDLSCLSLVNSTGIVAHIVTSDLSCLYVINAIGVVLRIGASNLSCSFIITATGKESYSAVSFINCVTIITADGLAGDTILFINCYSLIIVTGSVLSQVNFIASAEVVPVANTLYNANCNILIYSSVIPVVSLRLAQQPATAQLTASTKTIRLICSSVAIPVQLLLSHNLSDISYFSNFMLRNNFTLPDTVPFNWNSIAQLWQSNLNFSGLSSTISQKEILQIAMSLGCSNNNASFVAQNVWVFRLFISSQNLYTGTSSYANLTVNFNTAVELSSSPLDFQFTVNTSSKMTTLSSANVLFTDEGFFSDKNYTSDPRLGFGITLT